MKTQDAPAAAVPAADSGPSVEVSFPARDGHLLQGTLFNPKPGPPAPAVLIGPAMGVRRGFYARFALFLRQQGFLVLTFDYRGIGGSAAGPSSPALHQWGEDDLHGAIAWLEARAGRPVVTVAHSVAAQLLGLCGNADRLAGIVLVTPQSGQWRLWDGWGRLRVASFWFVGIPVVTRLFGRLPGWTYGGADLPAGVALEWARWGRHRDYILSHRPDTRAGFQRLAAPLLVYGAADDGFAPPRAVARIASWYGSARRTERMLAPTAADPAAIGHFGFFDRRFAPTLWREAAGWLRAAAEPVPPPG